MNQSIHKSLTLEQKANLVERLVDKLCRNGELPSGENELDAPEAFVEYECYPLLRRIRIERVTFGPNGEYSLSSLENEELTTAVNGFLDVGVSTHDLPENYLLR